MSPVIPKPESKVMLCPHCGNNTPQSVVNIQPYCEKDFDESGAPFVIGRGRYYLAECATCEEISLFLAIVYGPGDLGFGIAKLIWPTTKQLPKDVVPKTIIKTYDEATKIKKISPSLFAVQIGKALEFLCKEKKAKGKTLDKQIQFLSSKGVIPLMFSKMTDVLRILRNYGAHASDTDISRFDADLIDDFFNAIVEYVYIAPYKVETLLKKIKTGRKNEPEILDLSDVKTEMDNDEKITNRKS